jgi:hypothetical protein
VALVRLENGNAETAAEGFAQILNRFDAEMRRSMTYDRGREMARHQNLSERTGLKVYFAPPAQPLGTWHQREHQRPLVPITAINKRLREEFAKLRVEINEDKSRMVDLAKGESFGFLGFEYRRVLSFQRKWRPRYTPKLKKRTALFAKLKEIFRQFISWPVEVVIERINPILRGWVNYFRVGHSSSCFTMVKEWVERKVRRHLMRARGRRGFGWKRWSSTWFYDQLGLFNDYKLRRWSGAKVAPARRRRLQLRPPRPRRPVSPKRPKTLRRS